MTLAGIRQFSNSLQMQQDSLAARRLKGCKLLKFAVGMRSQGQSLAESRQLHSAPPPLRSFVRSNEAKYFCEQSVTKAEPMSCPDHGYRTPLHREQVRYASLRNLASLLLPSRRRNGNNGRRYGIAVDNSAFVALVMLHHMLQNFLGLDVIIVWSVCCKYGPN